MFLFEQACLLSFDLKNEKRIMQKRYEITKHSKKIIRQRKAIEKNYVIATLAVVVSVLLLLSVPPVILCYFMVCD